jgi:isocitrate dehydrogenase
MAKALDLKIDIIKTENLYEFDGVRGYSLGQGQ